MAAEAGPMRRSSVPTSAATPGGSKASAFGDLLVDLVQRNRLDHLLGCQRTSDEPAFGLIAGVALTLNVVLLVALLSMLHRWEVPLPTEAHGLQLLASERP